jgi:hypothetical protein
LLSCHSNSIPSLKAYFNYLICHRLEQSTSLGAANRADIATIIAETSYKEAYLIVSYRTISERLHDAKLVLFGQKLKYGSNSEGEEFEAGVLGGLGIFFG